MGTLSYGASITGLVSIANTCTGGGPCTALEVSTGIPAMWQPPILAAYKAFAQSIVTRYNGASPISGNVVYIRFGLWVGGEDFIWCASQHRASLNPQLNSQLKAVSTAYATDALGYLAAQQPSGYLLQNAPDGGQNVIQTCDFADAVAAVAVSDGFTLGTEGVANTDLSGFFTNRVCTSTAPPLTSSQGCSNNFCMTFANYQGQTKYREMQLGGISDPSGATSPGPLTILLPFATQRGVNVMELFPQDLFTAYDPHWSTNGTYGAAYASAIAAAATGLPNATTQIQGHAFAQGGNILTNAPGVLLK